MAQEQIHDGKLVGERSVVVKIYNPYPDLVGGKFGSVQEKIDKEIGNQAWHLLLFGQNSGTNENPYIQYAPNDDGPTPNSRLKKTFLVEYYIENADAHSTVEKIHSIILNEIGKDFTIQYMIISGVDMHTLPLLEPEY